MSSNAFSPVSFAAAVLDRHREKWREAPRGSDTDGRVFSSDLLALPDEAFLASWDAMAARRVATLKGLTQVAFHLIGDDLSFAALPVGFDAICAFGSIHHVPFDIARREALAALERLKPGGRWMELVYPRERWLREGALPFEEWGRLTDGERTPWVEWHDIEKVRRRLFPAPFRTLLDFEF